QPPVVIEYAPLRPDPPGTAVTRQLQTDLAVVHGFARDHSRDSLQHHLSIILGQKSPNIDTLDLSRINSQRSSHVLIGKGKSQVWPITTDDGRRILYKNPITFFTFTYCF